MRVKSNGRKRLSLEVPECSVGTSNESAPPDPEVLERAKRRRSLPSISCRCSMRPTRVESLAKSPLCCDGKGCIPPI